MYNCLRGSISITRTHGRTDARTDARTRAHARTHTQVGLARSSNLPGRQTDLVGKVQTLGRAAAQSRTRIVSDLRTQAWSCGAKYRICYSFDRCRLERSPEKLSCCLRLRRSWTLSVRCLLRWKVPQLACSCRTWERASHGVAHRRWC